MTGPKTVVSSFCCDGTVKPLQATLSMQPESLRNAVVVLDLQIAGVEIEQTRVDAVCHLSARNLGSPLLAAIDGNPGLAGRCGRNGPRSRFSHRLGNCSPKATAYLREELAEDYLSQSTIWVLQNVQWIGEKDRVMQ
jgi:hypothetical protein